MPSSRPPHRSGPERATTDDSADTGANAVALKRNVALIPFHQALTRAMVSAPVFVLFSRARFDLDGALLLGSMYYLFVVALEVPSGWMSDRLGRVLTLRVAAMSFVAAQACYLLGDERFAAVALGQFFLACGWASLSGTDVSFHYDTLEGLDQTDTYAHRQAKVSSYGFASAAVASVLGGVLGLVDLRLTFVASLLLAFAQLALTFRLTEPPSARTADAIIRQLVLCLSYLRQIDLAWIFFYGIILVTLEHVAFSMMQPWLTDVLGQRPDDVGATPLVAGLVFAVVAFVGAGAARSSAPLGERFGTVATLIGFAALSAVIVTGMALWAHWLVIGLVIFRSAQGAAAPVLISAAVAPRTEQHHRATFLSINSLAGRLGYGLVLLVVAGDAGDDVQPVLAWFSTISWVMVAVLLVSAAVVARTRPTLAAP